MSRRILKYKNLLIVSFIYWIILGVFSMMARPQIKYDVYNIETTELGGVIGGVYEGRTICQSFVYSGSYIQKITLLSATYNRKNEGTEKFVLKNSRGETLWSEIIPSEKIKNDTILKLQINKEVESENDVYFLEIMGEDNDADTSVTYYVTPQESYDGAIKDTDGITTDNLYMSVYGRKYKGSNWLYNFIIVIFYFFLVIYWIISAWKNKHEIKNGLAKLIDDYDKYSFLIKQLVVRDFKTKYKRSILGVIWSFLNPILTMAVQYLVFSTIFRSGIENFPVYLLSASILFGFFTESVGNGLGSITGNASLITKVSIPRHIYPVARVLSAVINLLMSTIPLMLVVLVTGESFNKYYIFIPMVYFLLLIFCIGLSMLLATSMVYFRDTLFLWGVVSMIWMYATPIFYPDSIIPARFSFILKVNPIYYYLKFFRTILLDSSLPELSVIGMCIVWSIVMLIIGSYIFRKNEAKFTLYI